MLLKFAITNFLSLRDRAEISFVAAPLKEQVDALIACEHAPHGVLPVLAIYGANASGKSNALAGLSFLRWFVRTSFGREDQKDTSRKPFLLDDHSAGEPSRFEIDFVLSGVRFQFGMSVDGASVISEWLYQYPKKSRQLLYEREGQDFKFGRSLLGSNKQIQSVTTVSTLFLSVASASGHAQLTPIRDYFRDKLLLQNGDSRVPAKSFTKELASDGKLRADIVKYLSLADTGISDIKVEKEQVPEQVRNAMKEFQNTLRKIFPEQERSSSHPESDDDDFDLVFRLGHAGADSKIRFLDLGSESVGTRYLLQLLPPMLKALRTGATLVLDEITTSLHTLLARQLVALFHDKEINKTGAQLVFTTHDTNLLGPGVLRRDEIWFAEKGRDGATTIYPLTDLKTKNTDNIERGYIQGRFGGIPFIEHPSINDA